MGNRLIEGLKTGQRYIFQVRAKNDLGLFGAYSDVVEITTSTEDTPRAPTNVVLTGVVEKWIGTKYKLSLTLTWTAPIEVVISKYEAILEEYSGGAWAVADMTNAEASPVGIAVEQKWVDYTPSGQYRARIRAISKGNTTGTWSDYATCTPTFTSDLPTPTGLTLKQEGKIITATVDVISQATYPQLAGYRFYASKQTAFTPGATNLIAEPKSNALTFQNAYDSVHSVIEEIAIGDTIYVRVSAFDAAGNESSKCAEVSILAGGAIPDAPTFDGTHKLVITPTTILGRVYNVKTNLKWIAPTNVELGSYEVEIYNALNGGGTLEKTLSPAKGTTECAYTDSDPNTDYSARIRAVNQWGRIGTWSAWSNAAGVNDATVPADPTITSVTGFPSFFFFKWVKNTEADLSGYIIYIYTSNTPASAVVIDRASRYSVSKIIRVGQVSETGGITIAAGTTYYFWLTAIDIAGNESANKVYFGSATAGTSLGVDTTAPTPNPPTGMASAITVQLAGLITRMQAKLSWTACTDDSGRPVHYHVLYWKTGETTNVISAISYTNSYTIRNLDPSITYYWKVASEDWYRNITSYCADQTLTVTNDVTAPAAPTITSITGIFQFFIAKWVRSTEADVDGYIVYVNTINSTPTKADGTKIISRTSRYSINKLLRIGEVTETSSGGITLAVNTTYYFWLSAIDTAGNESNLTAFGSASTRGGITPDIPIINTPAQIVVPSSFYLDLRAHNNDADTRHYTADALNLHNAANTETFGLTNVSETSDGTGDAGWRYFYVEYKISTADTQLVNSATSPATYTMTAGYDYFVYVGSCYWSGAAFTDTYQFNDHVWATPASILSNGHCASGTWTSIDISGYVPATAKMWFGIMGRDALQVGASAMGVSAGSNGVFSYIITLGSDAAPVAGVADPFSFTLPILTAQTCWWKANQHTYSCYNIAINGYIDDI